MDANRVPAGGAVIVGPLTEAMERKVLSIAPGKVTKVSESPPTYVVEAQAADPRALCAEINLVVGDDGVVAPILVDQDGNRLLPTGHLQVRFEERPTENMLSAFAQRHNVKFDKQSKWSLNQAEFSLLKSDTRYLPDITSTMAKDEQVAAVWPDVQARFRRSTV